MPSVVDDSLVPYLKRIKQVCEWIDSFRIEGDGVTVTNNGRGISIRINQMRIASQGGGIQDIRYNGSTHNLQVTYALAPIEGSWEDRIQFTTCSGATPGEFFSY